MSGALPGSVHDKAAWIWGVLAELEAAGLATLVGKGYRGSAWAKVPCKLRCCPWRAGKPAKAILVLLREA